MTTTPWSEFDQLVAQMLALKIPRNMAEAAARAKLNLTTDPADVVRDERVLENEEQREIVRIAGAYGFRVWHLSQYRPSKVARGFADLFLTHKRLPIACFWESKKQVGGKRSTPQIEFGDDCVRCNVGYGTGDRYAFVEKLLELELAARGAGQYGIEPIRLTTPTRE